MMDDKFIQRVDIQNEIIYISEYYQQVDFISNDQKGFILYMLYMVKTSGTRTDGYQLIS